MITFAFRCLAITGAALFLGGTGLFSSAPTPVKLNQIQVIGTHNSYHAGLSPSVAKLLQQRNPKGFDGLEYQHRTIPEQLASGVRQIEIDIYADTQGGRYAHSQAPAMIAAAGLPADPPEDPQGLMLKPGFKVMHVLDIDQRSSCEPFVACLQQVRTWSHAHPKHVPVFILVETKQGASRVPNGVSAEPFTPVVFDALDQEIRSVFPATELVTPDDVRGHYDTLNQAVLAGNWPSLESARGKVVFLLDQRAVTPVYVEGHPSLKGRVLFTNSTPGAPDAAFLERNEGPAAEVTELVKQGYLIRSRTDADTKQARTNDTTLRDAAITSGAQLLSTDYPASEPASWPGHFSVRLPGDAVVRCNPVNSDPDCASQLKGTQQ